MSKNLSLHGAGVRAFIALGANLGDPLKQLDSAVRDLSSNSEIMLVAISPVYESVPHGDIEQPNYYNAVVEIRTTLSPESLLACMQNIEHDHGRCRTVHWGARTLDLDLILFDNEIINTESLTVPHPLAYQREFVIQPLFDLDKDICIPRQGNVKTLVEKLPTHQLTEVRHGTTYYH